MGKIDRVGGWSEVEELILGLGLEAERIEVDD